MKVKTIEVIPINEDFDNLLFKIIINHKEVGIFNHKVIQTENNLFSSVFHELVTK